MDRRFEFELGEWDGWKGGGKLEDGRQGERGGRQGAAKFKQTKKSQNKRKTK